MIISSDWKHSWVSLHYTKPSTMEMKSTLGKMCILLVLYLSCSLIAYGIGKFHHNIITTNRIVSASIFQKETIKTCDFYKFQYHLCLDCPTPVVPTNDVANCTAVVYNRVPKCGSMTMSKVFRMSASRNKYRFIWITDHEYTITPRLVNFYARKINRATKHRFALVGHHYFFDFNRYSSTPIVSINMIREPVSWFVSAYSYFHNQSKWFSNQWWNKRPMLMCVRDDRCMDYILNTFGAVRFLCGAKDVCNNSVSADALQIAKRRVLENYLLVGITEEMDNFVLMLEHLLPNLFRNVTIPSRLRRQNVTKHKQEKTEEIVELLLWFLRYEIELYNFVKQRYKSLKVNILGEEKG